MKELPILFSAPMVRAILSGQKTQTRRLVKPQPTEFGLKWVTDCEGDFATWQDSGLLIDEYSDDGGPCQRACPYGKPGDRLWVRETWAKNEGSAGGCCYRADHGGACAYEAHDLGKGLVTHKVSKWKPSIHMPRWASRITLEITGVRVERLQDISEADAIAEGCFKNHNGYYWGGPHPEYGTKQMATPVSAFRDLWESINSTGSWESNPWVWAVEFKRIQPLAGTESAQGAINKGAQQ